MDAAIGMLVIGIIIFIVLILIIRWIGAWMLRIDEVIFQLKSINANLKNIKNKE